MEQYLDPRTIKRSPTLAAGFAICNLLRRTQERDCKHIFTTHVRTSIKNKSILQQAAASTQHTSTCCRKTKKNIQFDTFNVNLSLYYYTLQNVNMLLLRHLQKS